MNSIDETTEANNEESQETQLSSLTLSEVQIQELPRETGGVDTSLVEYAPPPYLISNHSAFRLYNSVRPTNRPPLQIQRSANDSLQSMPSMDEYGHFCRICRYLRSDLELISCPCRCTGSVGHVHLKCLQRWIRFRSDNHCEICNDVYTIPMDKKNYMLLFKAFFKPKYAGSILKTLLSLISVTPLAYFTLGQLITTIDSLDIDKSSVKLLIVGPAMLLATSLYFFIYFDWAISGIFRIKYILEHWWKFGDQTDDDDSTDLLPDDLDNLSSIFDTDWIITTQ